MARALVEFDYKAQESDELTLKKGDVIDNVQVMPGGWWEGTHNGRTGVFPDNFVKLIEETEAPTVRLRTGVMRTCRVLFSYAPMNDDELELKENDVLEILGEVEAGWWRGKLNDKVGVFPSNFVKEEVPIADSDKKDADTSQKAENTADTKMEGEEGRETSNGTKEYDPESPPLPPKSQSDLCQARYSYKAMNEDELTLHVGDIVTLLSRNTEEPGWWRGELNGKAGVFPDNFVEIIYFEEASNKPTASIPVNSNVTNAKSEAASKSVEQPVQESPVKKQVAPAPAKKPAAPLPVSGNPAPAPKPLIPKMKVQEAHTHLSSKSTLPANQSGLISPQSSEFDGVDRNAMLTHMTVSRVKAPRRRPPSTIYKDTADGVTNGNGSAQDEEEDEDIPEEAKPKDNQSTPKAPWVQELKMNQLRARSGQPIPPAADKKPVAIPAKPSEAPRKPSRKSQAPIPVDFTADLAARLRVASTTAPTSTPSVVTRTPQQSDATTSSHQVSPAVETPRVAGASNGVPSERPVAGQRPLSSFVDRLERAGAITISNRVADAPERPMSVADRIVNATRQGNGSASNSTGPDTAEEMNIPPDGDGDPGRAPRASASSVAPNRAATPSRFAGIGYAGAARHGFETIGARPGGQIGTNHGGDVGSRPIIAAAGGGGDARGRAVGNAGSAARATPVIGSFGDIPMANIPDFFRTGGDRIMRSEPNVGGGRVPAPVQPAPVQPAPVQPVLDDLNARVRDLTDRANISDHHITSLVERVLALEIALRDETERRVRLETIMQEQAKSPRK